MLREVLEAVVDSEGLGVDEVVGLEEAGVVGSEAEEATVEAMGSEDTAVL